MKKIRKENLLLKEMIESMTPLQEAQINNKLDLASRIYDLIIDKFSSCSEFAKSIDRQPSEISRWVSGTHNLTLDTLTEIACGLNMSIKELMQPKKINFFILMKKEIQVKTNPNTSISINQTQGNTCKNDHNPCKQSSFKQYNVSQ